MTVNPTKNIRLSRPNFNDDTWHDDVNDNFTKLDAAAGALGFPAIGGEWFNGRVCVAGERLFDAVDGSFWLCEVSHTAPAAGTFATDRAVNPDRWSAIENGLTLRGAWAPGRDYEIGDLVFDIAEYIVCYATIPHTSGVSIRADIANWAAIADLKPAIIAAEGAAAAAAASAETAADIAAGSIAALINGAASAVPLGVGDKFLLYDVSTGSVASLLTSDLVSYFGGTYAVVAHTHAYADLTSKPTTIAGFSITDAYTKAEVDSAIAVAAAGVGKRGQVRAATVGAITISSGLNNGDTIDGVVLATGDLVLVKNQAAPAENGVYVVGVVPVRDAGYDAWDEFPGSIIGVAEGSVNDNALFFCTANSGGTIDVTAISYTKLTVSGELLAANNLSDLGSLQSSRVNIGATKLASRVFTGTSDTLVLADAGNAVRGTNGAGNTVTIPANSTVAFPIDTWIALEQYGAGQMHVVPAGGVTMRSNGAKDFLFGQYASAWLHKIGTDEWALMGDIVV